MTARLTHGIFINRLAKEKYCNAVCCNTEHGYGFVKIQPRLPVISEIRNTGTNAGNFIC